MMRRTMLYILLAVIACAGMCNGVVAQSADSYKALVTELLADVNKPGVLQRADSLLADGVRRGDVKKQWFAVNVYVAYAFGNKDEAMMAKYAQLQRDLGRKLDNYRFYFNPYVNEADMLIAMQNYAKAFVVLSKMKKDAETMYGRQGLLDYYHLCGTLYLNTGKYKDAVESYKQAIEYRTATKSNRNAAQLYADLAMTYLAQGEYEQCVATADKGLSVAKGEKSHSVKDIMEYKCHALNMLRRYAAAEKVYEQTPPDDYHSDIETYNDIHHYCYHSLFDKARTAASTRLSGYDKEKWLAMVAAAQGDYKTAFQLERQSYLMRLDNNKVNQKKEYDFIDAANMTKALKEKNLALDLANAKLALAQTNLSLEHEQSLSDMEKANAENAALALDNQRLEVAKLEAENAHRKMSQEQRTRLEERQRRSAHNVRSLVLHLFGLLMVTALVLVWLQNINQRRLKKAIIRTEESERAKTLFLQNMSHEIRTPLNAIVGFSQILATQGDEFDEEQRREFSNIVDQNTEMLTTLIDDILDVSALADSSKGYTMQIGDCEANEMCVGAMASVRMRCPAGVKLYNTTDIEGLCPMKSDAKRVKQVLINFLTNAEKHTTEGEIRLHSSLSEHPGMVTFSVTDTGEGVPADKAEAIFERFEKLDTFVQGTGLGLNICRQIATKLGGEVRLDTSYAGPGARFVFILPLESVATTEKQKK